MKLWFKSLLGGLLALSLAPALSAQVLRVDIMSPANESALGFKPGTRQATATATIGGGTIPAITVVNEGSGYASAPTVTISGAGTGATATAVLGFGVSGFTVTNGGTGYTTAPTVTLTSASGDSGSGATATATIIDDILGAINITGGGGGYSSAIVTITGGGGSGATATATVAGGVVTGITIVNRGTGYTSNPTVTITDPTGAGGGATATAVRTGRVSAVTMTAAGTNYSAAPIVSITGGGGSGAVATAILGGAGKVKSITLTNGGTMYQLGTVVTLSAPASGTTATATAGAPSPVSVSRIAVDDPGLGYSAAPAVTLEGGGGIGAVGTAVLAPSTDGMVGRIDVTSGGSGYVSAPTVTVAPPDGVVVITARISGTASSFNTSFFVDGLKVGTVTEHTSNIVSTSWTPPQPGSYFVTATTVDKLNNTATSLPVRVFVEGTSIISPVSSSIVPNGSSVVITAEATKNGGFIKQIEFLVNGTSVGIDSTAPYSVPFTPAATGAYTLTARATDNNDTLLVTSPAVSINVVTPIGTPPTVQIVNPVPGSSLFAGQSATVTANAADSDGFISKVEFYLNGNLLGTDQAFPYSTTWQPTVAGTYSLMAIAFDDKANAVASAPATITVKAGLPTIEIASPTLGSPPVIQGSKVAVTVRAAGPDGGISTLSKITLLVDGSDSSSLPKNPDNLDPPPPLSEPFIFEWVSNVTLGTHTLAARVTDINGLAITSAEVPITIITNVAPTVTISNPLDGSSVPLGQVITVNAAASDADGSVAKVAFTVNGTTISEDTTSPFSATYTPLTAGNYQFQATVTDNLGKSVSSAVSTVIVAAPTGRTPYVSLHINNPSVDYSDTPAATPTDPIRIAYGSTLLLGASALDVDGTVTKVEFYANGILKATSYAEPYNYSYFVNTVGNVELVAVAYDNDANKVSSLPVSIEAVATTGTSQLKVELDNPLDGATYVAGEGINFAASTNLGSAGKPEIDFYINNSAFITLNEEPYSTKRSIMVPGTYEVRAVVRKGEFTTISAPARLTIVPNLSPSVSLSAPLNGSTYALGQSIPIIASASDPDGTISKVEFFVNGSSIGSDTSAPYSTTYTLNASGTYTVHAVATDNIGRTSSSGVQSVSVGTIVGKRPYVLLGFTNPAVDYSEIPVDPAGTAVTVAYGSKLLLTASAIDPDGSLSAVEFYANGVLVGSVSAAPYNFAYTVGDIGAIEIVSVAVDNAGNRVASNSLQLVGALASGVSQLAVTLSSPANGASVTAGAQTSFIATTNAPVSTSTKVDFYVDNDCIGTVTDSSYTKNYTFQIPGTYQVRAVLRRGSFVATSAPSLVTVRSNSAPTVTLSSPAAGSVFSLGMQQAITMTASAIDSDGLISKVEFYVNGESVASDTTAPYSGTYTPTSSGNYSLQAVATDNLGKVSYSLAVNVSVGTIVGSAPYVAMKINDPSLSEGDSSTTSDPIQVAYGSTILLSAYAIDTDGVVKQVEFYLNGARLAALDKEPYTYAYQVKLVGALEFSAIATDNDGNRVSSSLVKVQAIPASGTLGAWVKLDYPTDGASFVAGENIPFTASTNVGSASEPKVDLYLNNTLFKTLTAPPYVHEATITIAGTYQVRAVVRLGTFTTLSSTSTITVKENQAPTVQITSPANGSIIKIGSSATLAASASDRDGTINSVDFYVNGTSIGQDNVAPYSLEFAPGASGLYKVYAIARDNAGATTKSPTVTFVAALPDSLSSETVYKGLTGDAAWTLALMVNPDKTGLLLAYSALAPTKALLFTGLRLEGGAVVARDSSGAVVLDGLVNDTGFSGTFAPAGVPISFIIPVTMPSTLGVSTGLYSGSVAGRLGTNFQAVLSGDGILSAYLGEGEIREGGSAALAGDGSFTLVLSGGSRITGRLDMATCYLSGTVTGVFSGDLRAALASGSEITDSSLRGISTRAQVGTGDNVLIAGFILEGGSSKQMFLRAIGPSLAAAIPNGLLANPTLDTYAGGTRLAAASNDNWVRTPDLVTAMSRVYLGEPSSTFESVAAPVLTPGSYSSIVRGANSGTGIGLVEIYDGVEQTPFASPRLRALASRGYVGTGENVMIAGLVVEGSGPVKLIVRGLGPAIDASVDAPTLVDPMITLDDIGRGKVVRENDNWETGNDAAVMAATIARLGFAPLPAGSKDAAILVKLYPGLYSVTVRGRNNGTGVGMVEIYEVK